MGVFIKGIKIPDDCWDCYFFTADDECYFQESKDTCPLVEVKEPHGRLIDADAFIEKYGHWYTEEGDAEGYIGELKHLIEKQPPATAEPHWIPVTERLPEEETDVLVTVHFLGLKRTHRNGWNEHIKESYYVEVASHINGEWSSASDEYKIAKDRHKVIAWMPLPEAFKGETE